jgi:drug/metabolite transporter (DMT)-like permease
MSKLNAHLALLLAAAFWGFGNIAQKTVLEEIGPLSAVCLRCAIAALVMLPLLLFEQRQQRKPGWWLSMSAVAASFAIALIIQQVAYLSASVTNASFLVNTATVMTPLIAWLALREIPGRLGSAAAVMTLGGIFLISSSIPGFASINWGDAACLVSAFFYAVWMVALGWHAHQFGLPFRSALIQFAVAALAALPALIWWDAPPLARIAAAAPDLAVLGIFTTAAAFGLQTCAQRYTSASTAAVIVSAESIFGAIGAYFVLQERPTPTAFLGAAMIFIAILVVAASSGRTSATGAHRAADISG